MDKSAALNLKANDRVALIFFWSVWVVMLLTTLRFVFHYGLSIPVGDDWVNVPYLLGMEKITFNWLWSLHNEHRIPLPRLVWLGVITIFDANPRAVMILNVLFLSLASAILALSIRTARGRTVFADIFFPLCLMSFAHYEDLLVSFQISFVLSTFLFCAIVALAVRTKERKTAWTIALLCLLLPLCGANGLVLAVPVALWLAYHSSLRLRPFTSRVSWVILLSCSFLLIFVLSAFYFAGYHRSSLFVLPDAKSFLGGCAEVFTLSLGPAAEAAFHLLFLFPLSLIVTATVTLAVMTAKYPENRDEFVPLLFCILSGIALVLSVSLGRSGRGLPMTRYSILIAPVLCPVFIVMSLYGGKMLKRFIPVLMVLMLAVLLPANVADAWNWGELRLRQYQSFQTDLELKLPLEVIAQRNANIIFPYDARFAAERLLMMNLFRIGPFREGDVSINESFPALDAEDKGELKPAYSEHMELKYGMWKASAPGALLVYFLEQPQFVYGLRMSFVLRDSCSCHVPFQVFWAQSGRNYFAFVDRNAVLPQWPTEKEHRETLWVYDTVDRIRIIFGSDTTSFKLTNLTLLVLSPSQAENNRRAGVDADAKLAVNNPHGLRVTAARRIGALRACARITWP